MRLRSVLCAATAVCGVVLTCSVADATYALAGTYTLPGGTFDLMADGRLLAIAGDGSVLVQDTVNGSSYAQVGSVAPVNSSGFSPSFVSISPDGSSVAVGNNEFNPSNAVLFFEYSDLFGGSTQASPTSSVVVPNTDAAWADNNTLYVSGADSTTFAADVFRIDVSAGSPTTSITSAGAFSGAVVAEGGLLYAGAGDSGDVRAFDLATLNAAVTSVGFTTGALVGSHASAGSIAFDSFGNTIIAGGVFNPDFTITGSVQVTGPGGTQVLAPAGTGSFYGAFYNDTTDQLIVTADGTAYVYVIPAPGGLAAIAIGGVCALRRRR